MGLVSSFINESFPPKSKFSPEQIPDLTGQVFIVTGGNGGIGYYTVKALLEHNGKVYIATRSQEKATQAIETLKKETGKEALFLQLNLANLDSIKSAAQTFLAAEHSLNTLFNNAGVMETPMPMMSEDGYDLQFGTNVLGHYYFTMLLLPLMIETARTAPGGKARVVTTSSSMHLVGALDLDTVRNGPKRNKSNPQKLYAQSKFANVVFAKELARRYADQGIVSTSLNPGNLKTDLQKHMSPFVLPIINLLLYPAPLGALTQLWVGTAPEAQDSNGKYFIPWAREGKPQKATNDPATAKQLWEYLEAQVKDR